MLAAGPFVCPVCAHTLPAAADAVTRVRHLRACAPRAPLPAARPRKAPRHAQEPPVQRWCPDHKRVPHTPFIIDGFSYSLSNTQAVYFLTHFHGDHYGGITKGFDRGRIYCTPPTARLLQHRFEVPSSRITTIPVAGELVVAGVHVQALDANHCPGAAMFLFSLPNGETYLHSGDFRFHPKLLDQHPLLVNLRPDILYLDNTYLDPRYRFPAQEDVLAFITATVRRHRAACPAGKALRVVIGAYTIGKEKAVFAAADAFGPDTKIYAPAEKRRVLELAGAVDPARFAASQAEAPVHIVPLSQVRAGPTGDDGKFEIIGFSPTGWNLIQGTGVNPDQLQIVTDVVARVRAVTTVKKTAGVTVYGVPYSEHSSWDDLVAFLKAVRPAKIIPTVGRPDDAKVAQRLQALKAQAGFG